jgi:Ca-activated chloride channel homolog
MVFANIEYLFLLLLLLAEMLILERKNPLFRNIHLFSNKK